MTTAKIDRLIEGAGRSLWRSTVTAAALRVGAVVLAAVLGAVMLDALIGLSFTGRWVLDGLLLGVLGVGLYRLVTTVRQRTSGARRVALTIEARLDIPDNRLINAVDLSAQDTADVSGTLRDAAVRRGEAAAEQVSPVDVIDTRRLRGAWRLLGGVVMVGVLFYGLNPAVFHAVLPRLVMPWADLPAYTSVRFAVHVQPERVYVGKPADVRVTLSGPSLPGRASVVFEEDGRALAGVPMMRESWAEDASIEDGSVGEPAPGGPEDYTLHLERVEDDRRFYIDTPSGRSRWYTLLADRSPLIESARVTLSYPAYTGWPDVTRPLIGPGVEDQDDQGKLRGELREDIRGRAIRALEGTRVRIDVHSNVPLRGGELRLIDTADVDPAGTKVQPVEPHAIDPHLAGVGFMLGSGGTFKLSLTGLAGEPGAEALVGELRVVEDRGPRVDVVSPDRQVVVPEGWPVPVEVGAGDDIGISGAEVHVGVNDGPTRSTPLALTYRDRDPTSGFAEHAIEPGELGASAGDVVRYYAVAKDNHPDAPRWAETPIHAVHVITMQEYVDLARARYRVEDMQRENALIQQQLAELAALRETLLEAIETHPAMTGGDVEATDAQRAELKALQDGLNQYAALTESIAEDLAERSGQAPLYEFETPYQQMLENLSEQLRAQTEHAKALAEAARAMGAGDSPESSKAAQMAQAFAALTEPFDQAGAAQAKQTAADLERLALAEAMMREGERIRRVAAGQAELAVRVSGLAGHATLNPTQRGRAEALAREQRALRDELADASAALRAASAEAAEALPNMSAGAQAVVDQIEGLGIVSTQGAAEQAARAGRGELAHQAALKAAEDLDSLLSDTGPAMAGAGDLDGCFTLPRERMQSAMEQMMAGMNAGVPGGPGVPGMGSQGGQGGGASGSVATMTMMGPSVAGMPGAGLSEAWGVRGDPLAGGGHGTGAAVTEETGSGAEVLHAGGTKRVGEAVAVPAGVPLPYREQAAAYFRRIAEESRVE